MSTPSPPRAAARVLSWLLPAHSRDEVLRDLEAIWNERFEKGGRGAANRWYWRQVLAAVSPSLRRGGGQTGHRDGPEGEEGVVRSFFRDVAFAFTQLRRHRGVGMVVVLTLALGVGSTTAIFSAVNAVLLSPLPYEDANELVMVTRRAGGSDLPRFVSGPDFVDMQAHAGRSLKLAGALEATVGPMTEVQRPEHIFTAPVTWNLFEALGVDVQLGRNFNIDDAVPLAPTDTMPPALAGIISHGFWQRSFGGDPGIIGRVVHIWGGATEIVGVLPADFRLVAPPELNIPPKGDIWRVIRWDMSQWGRQSAALRVIGRLEPDMPVRQASDVLQTFAESLQRIHPEHAAEGTEFRVTSLEASVAGPMKGPLWTLMGAVTLVLLIACANVANLLLARGAARSNEIAVRSSLGAGSRRLVRQLLTESGVMAVVGAAGGIVLAAGGVALLHAIRPADLHRLEAVRLDLPVLAFTVGVAVTATLLSGLLPALQTTRTALAGRLSTRGATGAGRRSRTVLVIVEVALSVMLVVGAGLLIRTFGELQRVPLGFDYEQVLTVTATQSNRPREERQAYEADLMRAVTTVPGVAKAGIVFPLPMNGVYDRSAEYAMAGRETEPDAWTTAYFRTVNHTYFDAMGLQMKRGRQFESLDENYDVPTVIIDERLAAREFPSQDPVGQPLWVRGMEGDTLRAEIVGVVEYAPQWDHRDTKPTMYFPRVFYLSHEVSLVAKVNGDPATTGTQLSEAVRRVDGSFPSDLVPMERYVVDRLARSRFLVILMQLFGGLALGLSAVGLYGVLSYSVRQRTRELGLRLALGAERSEVTSGVVRSGMRLAAVGVAFGLVGAVILGQALRAQLFRVGPTDLRTLGGTAALVLTIAALASLLPAVRAARVDPVVALREE